MRNAKTSILLLAALLLAALPATLAAEEDDATTAPELAKIAEKLAGSFVVVELTIQSDKGEVPERDWNWMSRLQAATAGWFNDWGDCVEEERPAEFPGFLLADNRVLTADPTLHPRFIKQIMVRAGEEVVAAEIEAYGRDRDAIFLKLAQPLKGRRPLAFDTSREGPYFLAALAHENSIWKTKVSRMTKHLGVERAPDGHIAFNQGESGLCVDREGVPVYMTGRQNLPLGESWRQTPADWPTVSAAEMEAALSRVEQAVSQSLLRAKLRLRSPRSSANSPYDFYRSSDDGDAVTEWNGTAVLVDDQTALVLANLRPKVTARLEAIRLFRDNGTEVEATFAGTLKDYGAFLAKLAKPLSGEVALETRPIREYESQLLLKAQIRVLGESRNVYCWRDRIDSLHLGWRRQVYPANSAATSVAQRRWDASEVVALNFLYTLDGRLLAVPIAKRRHIASEESWYSMESSGGATLLAGEYVTGVLAAGLAAVDPENRPLTEEEENRLAWLGVELQSMTADLARMNGIADQTANGTTGAIVTYLYPDSPAAIGGLEIGDVLLRLHIEDQPKPLEIQLADTRSMSGMMEQLWSAGDQVPPEYFENVQPWGAVENALTRALTDIGFGKKFTAEVFRDGEILRKDFVVIEGPAHYNSAKRFKSKAAGLTVRDLTYEVRRYFRCKPDDPGVIVSKVERGSRANVAGITPIEIILSVNDQPVHSAAEFEQAIAGGGDYRLNVKRMTMTRVVELKVKAEAEALKESQPDTDVEESAESDTPNVAE